MGLGAAPAAVGIRVAAGRYHGAMSLNIKNPAVLELTRDLARLLGTSQVGALEVALREKLAREQAGDDVRREQIRRDLVEIRERLRGGPTRQQIDDDLYDEWGLPR